MKAMIKMQSIHTFIQTYDSLFTNEYIICLLEFQSFFSEIGFNPKLILIDFSIIVYIN